MIRSKCSLPILQFNYYHVSTPFRKVLLRKWLEKNGDAATYSALVKAMHNAAQINAIDELVKVLRDNPLPASPAPRKGQQILTIFTVLRHKMAEREQ